MAKVNRIHNHTDSSDMRLKDSNLFLKDLLDYSHEKGIDMVAITEHECLCDHVKAMRMREQYPDMKIALGNEIYLLDREEHDKLKEAKEKIKYYHFILLAKNKAGHECLRRLSSEAWEGMYFYRMMERVPTFKDRLEYYLNLPEYKGTIIGSTACLGGELGTLILEDRDYRPFIEWCINLFGEDFYLEMQPSHNEEQIKVNKKILEISEEYGIPYTISTDSHYKNLDSQKEHWNFLQSQDGDREVEDFYAYTYIMGDNELLEFFPKEQIDKANEYGEGLYNKIEEYDLFHSPILPPVFIPENFDKDWVSMFAGRFDLPYTQKYLSSPYIEDRYYLYLIEQGYKVRGGKYDKEKEFERINIELEQCWELSKNLGQHISKYHLAIQQILEIIWEISLIGPARGSASCFYLNYLIDLVQVNPLDYDLPYWRYMEKDKVELSDKYIVRVA